MTNNSLRAIFVFVYKLFRSGECNLVNELIYLLSRHADTVITYGQGLLFLIYRNAYTRITQITLYFAYRTQGFQLLRCIHGLSLVTPIFPFAILIVF